MNSKSIQVRAFFANADVYLERDATKIRVRSIAVRDLLGDLSGSRILDLGCGDGSISRQFLSETNRVTMVDLSSTMLERARSRIPQQYNTRVEYRNVDLHHFETTAPFDVILCIGILAHVDSVEETIERVAHFLKPGGRCIFQITDQDQIVNRVLDRYLSARALLRRAIGCSGTIAALSRGYVVNQTALSHIGAVALRSNLRLVSMRRHGLPFPGMRGLPPEWLLKYDLAVLRSRILSRFAGETLILFQKAS